MDEESANLLQETFEDDVNLPGPSHNTAHTCHQQEPSGGQKDSLGDQYEVTGGQAGGEQEVKVELRPDSKMCFTLTINPLLLNLNPSSTLPHTHPSSTLPHPTSTLPHPTSTLPHTHPASTLPHTHPASTLPHTHPASTLPHTHPTSTLPHPQSTFCLSGTPDQCVLGMSTVSECDGSVCQFSLDECGRKKIVVVGSGEMGLALTRRLVQADYNVTIASRNPHRIRNEMLELRAKAAGIEEALNDQSVSVVVLAIPPKLDQFPLHLLHGKILVDCTNRIRNESMSQAEMLQGRVGNGKVVKALNVLSAHALYNGVTATQVPVCSDDIEATRLICSMIRDLGFVPVNHGPLRNARHLEDIPHKLFPEWHGAFFLSLGLFIFFFALTLFEWDICNNIREMHHSGGKFNWSIFDDVGKHNVARSCAATSIMLLALCYLPGVFAGYTQLVRGTKYSKFPVWLDKWLRHRKQLGLIMLFTGAVHGILVIDSPITDGWRPPTLYATGVFILAIVSIQGVLSIPSVSLSWSEFKFMLSYLGWTSLIIAIIHVIFKAWDNLLPLYHNLVCYLPNIAQLLIVIPLLTVILKVPLLFADSCLTKIRQGYIRET